MIQDKTSLSIDRAVMNGIQEMVFIVRVDEDGLFYEFFNQAAMDKTDITHDSIGKTFFETQTVELAETIHSQYMQVLTSRVPICYEDSYIDPDRKLRYSKTRLTPMFDADGQCTHVVSIVQDITGEVEAKQVSAEALMNLETSRSYYQSLFEHHADAILTVDLNGRITGANPMGLVVGQLPEAELYKQRILNFVAPQDQGKAIMNFREATKGTYTDFRVNVLQQENKQLSVLVKCIPIMIQNRTTGFYVILKDMRELDYMVELYMESEKNFQIIAENAHDVIILINRQKEYLFISPSVEALYGINPEHYMLHEPFYNVHTEDREALKNALNEAIQTKRICKRRIRIKHKHGHWIWSELLATPVFDEAQSYSHMVIIVRDITLQKKYEAELKTLAYHDPLTNLPNRRYFQESLEQALREFHENRVHFAVMLLDVDEFKQINDQWGHETGDAIIYEFGRRLKTTVFEGDVVARLGGDEFIILLANVDSVNCALTIIEKIRNEMKKTWAIEGMLLPVSTSIGLAMPHPQATSSSLLKEADQAMYEEKRAKQGSTMSTRF
ncbi:diguanylate cyclase domain-containing protein [Planococcus halocryophilus]|uniref:diguanylate cyclase domain-containing protein n=1 Tax=Planococcus halocryophilus TaxID=1215089 RepID=UPI001F0F65CE|nr:diguanylate cyclase [Planococcus halocryophilus]MCH4827568.1 diguanylate cyclase [Planococcus halocryophilus]